jgi:hypothetical protein
MQFIVQDIADVIPGQGFREWPIYGSSRCSDYAWGKVHNEGEPTTGTVYNGMMFPKPHILSTCN